MHTGADSLLMQIATDWSEVLRSDDVRSHRRRRVRLLVSACTTAEAADAVRRLHVRMPEPYTCSIGLATWDGAEPADHLMARADPALYDAKREEHVRAPAPASPEPLMAATASA